MHALFTLIFKPRDTSGQCLFNLGIKPDVSVFGVLNEYC